MFNKITIYEVKVDKKEEFEELFQDIQKFYLSAAGVVDVEFFKRSYRQAEFGDIRAGGLPIKLKRFVSKITYVFCLSVENQFIYAEISKLALENYYKKVHYCLTTLPKVILGD